VRLSRLSAAGDVAGPVLFTVAWVVGSLRHAGHSAAEVQLSGLAAEDAWNPQIMMAGFVLLGAGTVVLGAGLGRLTAPRSAGPWLVLVADAASVAAGLFRRDHMLLVGPGFAGESWHNARTTWSAGSGTGRCSRNNIRNPACLLPNLPHVRPARPKRRQESLRVGFCPQRQRHGHTLPRAISLVGESSFLYEVIHQ
jgi:hypothetical protein